jgi:hypothetical protein
VTDVPVTATVKITFTESMRPTAVTYAIVPSVIGGLAWDGDGQLATFHHTGFQPGECYTFTVTAAKDLAGNPLSGTLTLTFTTQESNIIHLPLVVKEQRYRLAPRGSLDFRSWPGFDNPGRAEWDLKHD